jgi:hypothetical protein
MAALAHKHVAAPPADSAEAEMSEAAFAIIERASAICGHPPARELPAEPEGCLIVRATKILSAQILAAELLHEMKQRGDSDFGVSETCLVETDSDESQHCNSSLGDDETDEPPVIDWKEVAQDAWRSEGWARAAKEYRR